jgi:CHAT domain-containing protein
MNARTPIRRAIGGCLTWTLVHALVSGQPADGRAARDLVLRGQYLEACALAEGALQRIEPATVDRDSLNEAIQIVVDAGCGNRAATLARARQIYEPGVVGPPAQSLPAGRADRLLGSALDAAGRYREARPYLERAVTVARATEGEELARSLEALAALEHGERNYDAAAQALDEAIALLRNLASHPAELARLLARLAELHLWQNRTADGRAAGEEAQSLVDRYHPIWWEAEIWLIEADWIDGRTDGALARYEFIVAQGEARLGAQHAWLAKALRLYAFGQLELASSPDQAAATYRRALRVATDAYGAEHPEMFHYQHDLALALERAGRLIEADRAFQQALELSRRVFGPGHVGTAVAHHNRGRLLLALGDWETAVREERQAVELWHRHHGADHRLTGLGHLQLGMALIEAGQPDAGAEALRESLRIFRRTLADDNPSVVEATTLLARARLASGSPAEAHRLMAAYERSLPTVLAPLTDDLKRSVLTVLGSIDLEHGSVSTVTRERLTDAVKFGRAVYGAFHPDVADMLARLALANLMLKDPASVAKLAAEADAVSRRALAAAVPALPERVALTFAANRPEALDILIELAVDNPADAELSRLSLERLASGRGLVLDALLSRSRSRAGGGRSEALFGQLAEARARVASLMMRRGARWDSGHDVGRLERALAEKERLERAVARQVGSRGESLSSDLAIADLQGALGPDDALVSYVRYRRHEARPERSRDMYAAFVLRAGSERLSLVDLGPALSLDGRVAALRAQLGGLPAGTDAEERYRRVAARVRESAWDPLAPFLRGATRVFVVPEGALHLVSFAALPTANSYIIDDGPEITYASAERDLLDPGERTIARARGLLALGAPAFSSDAPSPIASSGDEDALRLRLRSDCDPLAEGFRPLPASGREVRAVSDVWRRAHDDEARATVLEGPLASEAAFKQQAGNHRVLHLATHTFFWNAPCADGASPLSRARSMVERPMVARVQNPVILSGLALAGANHARAAADANDGLLTAEEISGLDLSGVEWVVLSACDTGAGAVQTNEGVFGLQRAFRVAGARTVIMTLWPVDDSAAAQWTRRLYEHRFARGETTSRALRLATLSALEERRARGDSTHPFYWGAFVAVGDWR